MKSSITQKINKGVIILIWLMLWQVAATIIDRSLFLPSPIETINSLKGLIVQSEFWISIVATLWRVIQGLVISFVLGGVLGVLAGINKKTYNFLEPPIVVIKSIPIMAIIILALVWMKSTYVPVFVSVMACLPIVYSNIVEGVKSVDKKGLEVAKIYKVKKIHILKDIYLPHLESFLKSTILICIGLSWKATVTAEVMSFPRNSIGNNLYTAKAHLNTEELFAWTLTIVILSLIFEMTIKKYINTKGGSR